MTQKIHFFFSLQYFILLLIFALIPKSSMMLAYIIEIGLFTFMTMIYAKRIKGLFWTIDEGVKVIKCMTALFLLSLIFLYLSFRNLADYWNIINLEYNKLYIPRHYFIIVQYFISIGLGYSLYRSSFLTRIKSKWIILFLIATFLATSSNFATNSKSYSTVIVLIVSLLGIRNRIFHIILPFLGIFFTSSSTYVLAIIALTAIIYFKQQISSHLRKHGKTKLFIWGVVFFIIILLISTIISETVDADANASWRLIVWKNELATLAKTYYTGVGFGTAYVSNSIFAETDNLNMYLNAENGYLEGIFIVANHNSVLNMFYRMGLIGGTLFMLINVYLLSWCLFVNKNTKGKKNAYLWWAVANYIFNFIVLLFNPGLEMMQFSVGYQLSLAILLSLLFQYSAEIKILTTNK